MPALSITISYADLPFLISFSKDGKVMYGLASTCSLCSWGFHSVHCCYTTPVRSSSLPKRYIYWNQRQLLKKEKKQQIFKLVYGHITVHFLMRRFDWYCYYCLQLQRDKWVLPGMVIVLFLSCYTVLQHWVAMDIPIALQNSFGSIFELFFFNVAYSPVHSFHTHVGS